MTASLSALAWPVPLAMFLLVLAGLFLRGRGRRLAGEVLVWGGILGCAAWTVSLAVGALGLLTP